MAIDPSVLLQAKQIDFNPNQLLQDAKNRSMAVQESKNQIALQQQHLKAGDLEMQQQQEAAAAQKQAQQQESAFQAAYAQNPSMDDNQVVALLGSKRGSDFNKARQSTKMEQAKLQADLAEAKSKQAAIESQYTGGLARTVMASGFDPIVIGHVLDVAGSNPDHAPVVNQIRQALQQGGPEAAKSIFTQLYEQSRTTSEADKAAESQATLEETKSHNRATETGQARSNARIEAESQFNNAIALKKLGLEQARLGIEQQKVSQSPDNVDLNSASDAEKKAAQMLVDGKIGINDLPTRGGYRTRIAAIAGNMDDNFTVDRRKTMQLFKTGKEADALQNSATLTDHLERFIENSKKAGVTGKFNPFSTDYAAMKTDAKDIAGITNKLVNNSVLSVHQAKDYAERLESAIPSVREKAAQEMYDLASDKIREAKLKYEKGTGQPMPESLTRGTVLSKQSKQAATTDFKPEEARKKYGY